jgi:putative endonuclease
VADYYRVIHHCPEDTPIRFDVVAVDGEEMNWIKDAFSYIAQMY